MNSQTKNTVTSAIAIVTNVVCGLIMPRAILLYYGSEMNGLAQSVSQFLRFAVVLELGLGAVIPAAFYTPLVEKDYKRISEILSSSYRTYRKISLLLLVYIILLAIVFPSISKSTIPHHISSQIIIITGLGSFISFFAGKPESYLLLSDQKGYIISLLSIGVMVVTTIVGLVLILMNASFRMVKMASLLATIPFTVAVCTYVSQHYPITRRITYSSEPIPQKWNGIAQHLAYIVLEYTDVILITIFLTLREVSVYSVYYMVIAGIKRFFTSITYSFQPKLGDLWARGEAKKLNRFFDSFECFTHLCTIMVFACVGLLIIPFVMIYTAGINDVNYHQTEFATIMVLAHGIQCLRDPYDKLILASGQFKETQKYYIVAALLNIISSSIMITFLGLPGIALGTLFAMLYQVVFMSRYVSKRILLRPMRITIRQFTIDGVLAGLILLFTSQITIRKDGFISWLIDAGIIMVVSLFISFLVYELLYRKKVLRERGLRCTTETWLKNHCISTHHNTRRKN